MRRYRNLSATTRGDAGRAICAAFGVESGHGHQWLPSARLEPPVT